MKILLTGFTGNLGVEIARQLAGHEVFALVRNPRRAPRLDGVGLVAGGLEDLPSALSAGLEGIIHGAASTAFKSPLEELRRVNVEGTARLLEFARACPRLRRFLHLSTTCVCGDAGGRIPEAPLAAPAHFINGYEQSKWEAEALVLGCGLPVEILRLSIVAGSERDGAVRRPGALHHTLHWLYRGLIPMMPGCPSSRVDLISTEFAAALVARILGGPGQTGRIVHGAAGEAAPTVAELFAELRELFVRHSRGWARGAIVLPDLVDAGTFALFEDSVRQSGDLLFRRVCDDAQSFLPGLLHPRTMATSLAREIPCVAWRKLARQIFTRLLASDWGRNPILPDHDAA